MKKQHLFKYRLFSAVFDTQKRKYDVIDVIVTSLWFDYYCFWEILCYSTTIPTLVVIGQQIKEKRRGTQCPPPQPIWFQNTPILNRVKV